jgi:hypothetical protein
MEDVAGEEAFAQEGLAFQKLPGLESPKNDNRSATEKTRFPRAHVMGF